MHACMHGKWSDFASYMAVKIRVPSNCCHLALIPALLSQAWLALPSMSLWQMSERAPMLCCYLRPPQVRTQLVALEDTFATANPGVAIQRLKPSAKAKGFGAK